MKRKVKINTIMVVSRHLIYGGTEKYTLNLVNSLAEKGISVVLITGNGPLVDHVSPKVSVHILPISRNMRVKQFVEKKILEIAQTHQPQLIHVDSRTSMVCAQLTRNTLNIPLISHEHHMYQLKDYPFIISELKEGADQIITIGPYTRKLLSSHGYRKERIKSIINGINLVDYPVVNESERTFYRERFGFSESDKIVLCISRVVNGKGLDKLVMGFKLLARRIKNAKLVIVGDDEEHDHYRQILKLMIADFKLEKKVFLFSGDFNIRKFHAIADVFCYPALAKGMSVMEAMSSGLPIVGKRTDRRPLVVEHMVSGLMTEATKSYKIDPGQLAEKLSYLLRRPKVGKRMGVEARKKIEARYDLERHIMKLLKVYREVLVSHEETTMQEIPSVQMGFSI